MSKLLNKKRITYGIVIIVLLIVCIILNITKPSEETMMSQCSPEIQKQLEAEKDSVRKTVTVTYNSLGIINYCSFSTTSKNSANAMRERFVGFAGKVYPANEGAAKITGQMVNYTYRMLGCGENVFHGAKLTILLTTLTVFFGFIISIFLALGKISKNFIISKVCSAYIFFFRGTPLLIQMFVVYFAIPGIFGFAWKDLFAMSDVEAVYMGAFLAALISFSLNCAAYCAEIVRAAIQSIDKGQAEAGKALGLTYGQTMRKIIIPQSVRRMIPPVCNEFIMILKDASLVFAISLMDITTISKVIMTNELSYLVFIPALIIYLIITAFFTYLFNKIEAKFSVYE
ncbi:MAG: amino acid ABC transporter permease [Lachnospiraceae bacterium]|nr:amino acid ABC transporter permease [Lachnospiraceae bacterium]